MEVGLEMFVSSKVVGSEPHTQDVQKTRPLNFLASFRLPLSLPRKTVIIVSLQFRLRLLSCRTVTAIKLRSWRCLNCVITAIITTNYCYWMRWTTWALAVTGSSRTPRIATVSPSASGHVRKKHHSCSVTLPTIRPSKEHSTKLSKK